MTRQMIVRLLGMVLTAVTFAVGCVSNKPAECNVGGSLFADDFNSGNQCGWALYNQSGTVTEIVQDRLQITANQPGQIWWTNPSRNFDDVIINVDTQQMSGPDDNAYGIICRYQSEENFYIFLISGDGYYAIGKYQSGSEQVIYLSGDGQYAESSTINTGAASNQLRASCIGNELSLAINGIPVATVQDPTFVTGDVGIAATTFEPGPAVIQFDNFQVIAP